MSSVTASFSPPSMTDTRSTKTGSSHSRGSFRPLYVVLAIITILAAISCFLGQVLARRYFRPRASRDHAFHSRGDMEDGFEMGISPPVKAQMNGGTKDEDKHAGTEGTKIAR